MVEREKFDHIEERLRVIERGGNYAFADMADLCLVPDVVIPPKFKVPDIDKYKGTTCPKNHLKMFYRKMGSYATDEKLLMHFFQESLTGAAVTWYTNLESSWVRSWKDLMVSFIRQYQYNSDMAPNRIKMHNMCKREHESSKEYAQRWRDLAAQVVPPMMEREMITMIVDTLPVFYYEKMTTYMPSSFADLVFAGKRIEVGLKSGKFDYAASMNSSDRRPGENGGNKKEGETHVVAAIPTWPNFPLAQQYQYSASINPSHYPPLYQPRTLNHPQRPPPNQPQNPPDTHPRPNTTPNTNQNTNQGRNFLEKKHVKFTPLPMTYADLLPYLLNNAMAVISQSKISQPPFPRGYNPNMTCGYHRGVPGHSIEHCMTLKHKVQSLIDVNWLRFEEENRS